MATTVLRVCASCGRENRVAARDAASEARCGVCKTALPLPTTPVDVDPDAFDRVVSKCDQAILVDFWAAWCAPCRMAAPEVAKVAATGQALVLKVDTEAHPSLAARYGVRGIPNFVVLHHGRLVRQESGATDARTMLGWLRSAG